MGTVCGIFNRKCQPISDVSCTKTMEKLTAFPHDTASTWNNTSVFLGNTNKFITIESQYEQLPRFIEQLGLVITADAIIDNRNELLSIFNISGEEATVTSDSELIVQAYIKWGYDCPKYIVGDFTFAIWDEKKNELFCARDHVGKRTFYYYLNSEIFAFCTTIKPILHLMEEQSELNEEWIANYLALHGPIHEVNLYSTVYKDILQLPPAHTLLVTNKGMKIKKYWNPLKTPKLKLNSNEEYEEAFRKVFYEAVNCRLRGMGSVGVMLSGGLDSGSIACIAADIMKESENKVKGYCAVPFSEYKNWLDDSSLADEREFIQTIIDMYDNIDIKYCDSEGINSYNSIDRLTNLLEHPFKFTPNFFWMDEIALQSGKDKCSTLLDGQSGNYTVSFGDFTSFIMTLLSRGRWLTALREIQYYCVLYNRNYQSVIKYFFILSLPESLHKLYRLLKHKKTKIEEESASIPINPQFASIWKTDRKLKKAGLGKYLKKSESIQDIRKFIAGSLLFSQAGEAETKLSLEYGIIKRDPTRDKRVIEFCMSLPIEQYVSKGVERSLIRRAMEGILPDQVRLNCTIRGTQSADWIQRLLPDWLNIKAELLEIIENDIFRKFLDVEKIQSILESMDEGPKDEQYYEVQMIMGIVSLGRFTFENAVDDKCKDSYNERR